MSSRVTRSRVGVPREVPATILRRVTSCGQYRCQKETDESHKRAALRRSLRSDTTSHGSALAPPIVHQVLASPGKPLDTGVRGEMEGRFGADFSRVRVHTGEHASRSAREVAAHAYTVGSQVVFGAGQYRPASEPGRLLLAHELSHVAQQRSQPDAAATGEIAIGDDHDPAEREARRRATDAGRDTATSDQRPILRRMSVGQWFARLFGEGTFSDQELQDYLQLIDRTGQIEDHFDSDNKAREIVRRWARGAAGYQLSVQRRIMLIREMLSGFTFNEDEQGILTILRRSTTPEVRQILDPTSGVPIQDLDNAINGEEWHSFRALLESRFPNLGAGTVSRQGAAACDAAQRLMIDYARQRAISMINHTISCLRRLLGAPRSQQNPAIANQFECYFPQAERSQIRQVLARFMQAKVSLPRRFYNCVPFAGIRVRLPNGSWDEVPCIGEYARAYPHSPNNVYVCPEFFNKQSPLGQAMTVIHETMHMTRPYLRSDPQYRPSCGLPIRTALINPDSYAYLAAALERTDCGAVAAPLGSQGTAGVPRVVVGHFRNSGALSPDNMCPIRARVPRLGPDPSSASNYMEVRGDISGHVANAQYDFKRTKEINIWVKEGARRRLHHHDAPGTPDDIFDTDEDLRARNNRIYAVDGPGFQTLQYPLPVANATEAIYHGNYVESVDARVGRGSWHSVSNLFSWHSVTWLEKVRGTWRRRDTKNRIEPGHLSTSQLFTEKGDFPLPAQDRRYA